MVRSPLLRQRRALRRALALVALLLPGALAAQGFRLKLTGMVVDNFGNPLPRADIVAMGTPFRTLTDSGGKFTLVGVEPGPTLLMVRKLGYAPQMLNLHLSRDEPPLLVELEKEAQVLAGVRIEAKGGRGSYGGKMAEFGERLNSPQFMRSQFMTRDEIEQKVIRLGDAIRRFQGFRVYRVQGGRERVAASRGMVSVNQRCEPLIFIDGVFHATGDRFDLDGVVVAELAGIEAYRGSAALPPRYNIPGAACGVIGLWTRVGS